MPRQLSLAAREALYAEATDAVFLLLLTIDEASLSEPLRVVLDTAEVTSRGNLFVPLMFEIDLPEERGDSVSSVRIRVDNVDRRIVEAVRLAIGRPQVLLEVVLADDPDTVEAGPFQFSLESAEYDHLWVTGELVFDEIVNRRAPAHTYSPYNFPDAFRQI
mgnify:CR=1 FL=1